MADFLRILYQFMYNRLIILTFGLFLFGATMAQDAGDAADKSPFVTVVQENKIDIYPNPAVKHLTIQISNSTLENVEFEMHSVIGNQMTIRAEDLGQGKYKIPVEAFSTGYYFLIVKDEKARFKKAYKFLKD